MCLFEVNPSWATEHIDRFDTMKQMADGHYFGLWMRCEHFSTGVFTCDHYDNLIMGASKELIGGRVGMIAGAFLDILAIMIMMAAIDCTTMLPARKRRTLRMWAGILVLIGGIAMCKSRARPAREQRRLKFNIFSVGFGDVLRRDRQTFQREPNVPLSVSNVTWGNVSTGRG